MKHWRKTPPVLNLRSKRKILFLPVENRRKFSPFLLKHWSKNPPVLKSRSERKILFLLVEKQEENILFVPVVVLEKKPSGIVV